MITVPPPHPLSIKQAHRIYMNRVGQISRTSWYRYVAKGAIHTVRVGARDRIELAELDRVMAHGIERRPETRRRERKKLEEV